MYSMKLKRSILMLNDPICSDLTVIKLLMIK
jgi:hypothetical protein